MLTLRNKLTLLLGFGVLITLLAVSTFSDTAKAAGETYSWLGSGNISASGGYYTAPATIILDTQTNKWVLKTGSQLNFNGSKCTAGAEFNIVFNVDKSKNTIAYSGSTIGSSPGSACPNVSKLGTNTVAISGGAPTTPIPSTPTSCDSYIDANQNTVCRTGMSYYGNSTSNTAAADTSCDNAQYSTDANSNKIQLIAICKQGVVFAYNTNMAGLFAPIRALACDGESGGVAASCMSSFDTNLTRCTNNSRGDIAVLKTCLVAAYPSLADQINAITLAGTAPAQGQSTCTVDGIGWIICPVMNLMSHVVDAAYNFVSSLLTVQPLMTTGGTKEVYTAWSTMRTFANVAFVIAFIIIIYSQLTGAGINNYGIKKMLPRLIVAAILVNVSYWICAIAVDLSNIIGTSMSGLFKGLESPNFGDVTATGSGVLGWVGITGVVLATAGVALYVGLAALIPAGIAAAFAILTVFLVLTLRQALIILLVIVSPLAFVAYLLPNTEGYFKKWLKLFQTLLLMFPIIALIFGASALASGIVMAGASGPYKIAIQIMGALIAIIPLALTPLVMKTAGGLLGKFGGAINNPNKGPFDRMKKGAQVFQDRSKVSRRLRAMNPEGRSMPGRAGVSRFFNNRSQSAKARTSQLESQQNTDWLNSRGGASASVAQAQADLQNQAAKNAMNTLTEKAIPANVKLEAHVSQLQLDAAKEEAATLMKAAGTNATSPILNTLDPALRAATQKAILDKGVASSAGQMAQNVQAKEYADAITADPSLADAAGGIDRYGASKALASATSVIHKQFDDAVTAEKSTMTSMDIGQLQAEAYNPGASEERRSAAVGMVGRNGGMRDVLDTVDNLGAKLKAAQDPNNAQYNPKEAEILSSMQKQFFADGGQKMPISMTGPSKGAFSTGAYTQSVSYEINKSFTDGKFSGEKLASLSSHELGDIAKTLSANANSYSVADKKALKDSILEYNTAAATLGKSPAPEIAKYLQTIESSF